MVLQRARRRVLGQGSVHLGVSSLLSISPRGVAYLFGAVEAEGPWGHVRIDHIDYSDQQIDFSEILGGEAPVCDDECTRTVWAPRVVRPEDRGSQDAARQ